MKKAHCIQGGLILTMLLMFAQGQSASAGNPDAPGAGQNPFWVYIGTKTRPPGNSKGIYLYRLDAASGALAEQGLAAQIDDPGWQVITRDGKFLYTCATSDNHRTSIAAAYRIDRQTGALSLLNQQATKGQDTTHIDVDPAGSCAVVANYSSGDMSVMPINPDGTLAAPSAVIKHTGSSVNPDRQRHAYPHSCNFDPSGKFVLVPDLGVDKVYVYRFDPSSRSLSPGDPPTVSVPPGSGPRHLSFHPNAPVAYLINEMGGTVIVYAWDAAHGRLRTLQTVSTLPPDYKGNNTSAEVRIHPNGRFLYASNRGPNDLAIFAVDPADGTLKLLGFESTRGKGPRDFALDPTGGFLFAANQDSDTVTVFRVSADTGLLSYTGQALSVPTPICVKFLAVGK